MPSRENLTVNEPTRMFLKGDQDCKNERQATCCLTKAPMSTGTMKLLCSVVNLYWHQRDLIRKSIKIRYYCAYLRSPFDSFLNSSGTVCIHSCSDNLLRAIEQGCFGHRLSAGCKRSMLMSRLRL
jgi:hypothetical protein